jgi:fatty acid desaturase
LLAPWRSALALALDWALILACFAGAIRWPSLAMDLAAAVLIARTQLALAVMMHEGAHGLLARDRRVNDLVGQLFAAGPLLLSMFAYRRGHLQHHRAPMADDDPVARVFGIGDYPVTRRELAWRLFKDASSIGYFLTLRDLLAARRRGSPAASPSPAASRSNRGDGALAVGAIVLTNGMLFGGLAALGHPWLYLGLWIAPALTWLQLFARIRAITEHAGHGPNEDQRQNARTIMRPNWQTFFCGPHAIHFHIEHHRHVRVPFYRLRAVHDQMRREGQLPVANLYRGYGQVLKDVTHR